MRHRPTRLASGEQYDPKSPQGSWTAGFIAAATAAIGTVFITLITVPRPVPERPFLAILLMLSAAMLLLVFCGLLGTPTMEWLRKQQKSISLNRTAKRFMPRLRDLIQDYLLLLNENDESHIVGFVGSLKKTAVFSNLPWLHPNHSATLLRHVLSRATGTKPRYECFESCLAEFEDILRMAHSNTIVTALTNLRLQTDKIEAYRKESYPKCERNYQQFIDAYLNFNKQLVRELKEERYGVYFSDLPKI